jgi:acetyl esterase/lipase
MHSFFQLKRISLFLLLPLFLTSCFSSSINTDNASKKWLDVPYATASETQKLDIYLPKTGTAPYPVIIAVHGGAFKFGSKTGSDIAAMFR